MKSPNLDSHGEVPSICVYSIATGPDYFGLWLHQSRALAEMAARPDLLRLELLTDDVSAAVEPAAALESRFGCGVGINECPPYRWPEATLFRFELMRPLIEASSSDLSVYLDVDMEVNDNWDTAVINQIGEADEPFLVPHPGFPPVASRRWRGLVVSQRGLLRTSLYSLVARRSRVIGAWESSPRSTAFVRPALQRLYFHGAVWFGRTKSIGAMINELAIRVRADRERGVQAVWHDESHLNWFGAERRVRVASQHFSTVRSWAPYSHEPWTFSSIDKDFARESTSARH